MNQIKHFTRSIVGLIAIFSCSFISSCSHEPSSKNSALKHASEYFPKEKAQVLVVGTFHFDYPGLDYNRTPDENKIDVLVEPKKSEVTELVEYIKKFRPNKIAIEATPGWGATEKLKKYKNGELSNERDERYQLGMRIATELQIDTLYEVDVFGMSEDLVVRDSSYIQELFKDFDFQHDDPYNQYMTDWYNEEDKLVSKINLLEYFKLMNSRESHNYGYGAYLVGDFKLDDYRGADVLSIWWYNRNLRIFRNLQKITESSDDRILMIFGNGHAAIFRQLLEASPEYDFVEFESL